MLAQGLASCAARIAAAGPDLRGEDLKQAPIEGRVFRIGVISARIEGRPQPSNGHTWHFAQYFHPEISLEAIRRYQDPGSVTMFEKYLRNPRTNFGVLPFPDTRITHYYEADREIAARFCEAFPGVQVATTLEQMTREVDAIYLGDASGLGEDHFDLVAPGLERGLPTFCDKPIGGSVAGTASMPPP
jgi:predicted dehydrogenase